MIRQELVRISQAVQQDQLGENAALQALASDLKASGGRLHLLGLLDGAFTATSITGGLLRWAAVAGIQQVCIHGITDGRDTPTDSSPATCKPSTSRSRRPALVN